MCIVCQVDDMILCDGNYDLGVYDMDSVHNREAGAKPGNHLVK